MWRSVPISNEQRINLTGYRAAHAATVKPRENERFHGLSDFVYIRGPRSQNRPGFLLFRCATISLGFPRDFVFHYGSVHLLGYRSFRVVSFDFENFKSSFFASFQKRTLALFFVLFMSRFYDCSCFCIDYLFHFEFRYFEIIFVTNMVFHRSLVKLADRILRKYVSTVRYVFTRLKVSQTFWSMRCDRRIRCDYEWLVFSFCPHCKAGAKRKLCSIIILNARR